MFKASIFVTAVTALSAALLLQAPATADSTSTEGIRLQTLIESGDLVIDPVIEDQLDGGRVLSLVRVTFAPGLTEPRHSHPGPEILYGLAGNGSVSIAGESRPITPGAVIRVPAGKAKAISNDNGTKPLVVLALLVLDPDKPPLTVIPSPN